MENPTNIWHCDVCGKIINGAADGYIIWKRSSTGKSFDFKIVHHNRSCTLKDHTASSALVEFIGVDGLTKMLSHLSVGPVKINLNETKELSIENIDEFVDLIRRIHTPIYEQVRQKFDDPAIFNDLYDCNEVSPYLQDSLKSLANKKIS